MTIGTQQLAEQLDLPVKPIAIGKPEVIEKEVRAADDAFERELIRVYGKREAADARYLLKHVDAGVQRAANHYKATSRALHDAFDKWRALR